MPLIMDNGSILIVKVTIIAVRLQNSDDAIRTRLWAAIGLRHQNSIQLLPAYLTQSAEEVRLTSSLSVSFRTSTSSLL